VRARRGAADRSATYAGWWFRLPRRLRLHLTLIVFSLLPALAADAWYPAQAQSDPTFNAFRWTPATGLDIKKALTDGAGWAQFPRDVFNNWFGKWADGTPNDYKNEYRARVIAVCLVAAAGAAVVSRWLAIIPAAVIIVKIKLILSEKPGLVPA
jgi:hypothetical protein